ncbi:hypothetical protein QK313_27635, partial [Klebsiella michiganensis]|nr:hypothetical protein [Klebsiella michiganensis]
MRNSFVPTAINSFSPHHDPLHNFLLPDADCRAWLSNNQPAPISFGEKKPASALRDPHKTALINQHHTSVGSGEVVKNGAQ